MDPFDDLPKRHKNHVTENKAEVAFQNMLSNSEEFVLQASDRKDYGTDCQIEVTDQGRMANIRIHVQLKGTERAVNADESVSIEIRRSNLNYLLMQPHSFFVCYHVPTNTLRFCSTDAVIRLYEHSGQNWLQQQTITVTFSEILTNSRLKSLSALAKSSAVSSRNTRVRQTTARPEDLLDIVQARIPELHVPEDEEQAALMLSHLYEGNADEVISTAFEKFAAILSLDHDAMIFCYMAEINLGMSGESYDAERISAGISCLTSKLNAGSYHAAGIHYSIGNGLSVLRREDEAVKAYETALEHIASSKDTLLLAMCYKNLGSSCEKLGDEEKAADYFRKALYYNSQLPEAHLALGLHYLRKDKYEEALEHFDQVVFAELSPKKQFSVLGWRINALFNLRDGKAAFREINTLLSNVKSDTWIWAWCARQVASFGRTSLENARLSIPFWERYLGVHPNCSSGVREQLLNKLYLRSKDQQIDITYLTFKAEFDSKIQHVLVESAALLWDRLGHWAQDDDNWEEAERCFRSAYDLAKGHYGYCLGTALNFLERPEESLPILLSQAEEIQPDDMSWYQVAVAYEKLGRMQESIEAYQKAITLNPDYDLAWFNLGGVHWNSEEWGEARQIWKIAIDKFPEHELVAILRRDFSFILD